MNNNIIFDDDKILELIQSDNNFEVLFKTNEFLLIEKRFYEIINILLKNNFKVKEQNKVNAGKFYIVYSCFAKEDICVELEIVDATKVLDCKSDIVLTVIKTKSKDGDKDE